MADLPRIVGDRYRLTEPLGRGSLGTVFRGEHVDTGAPVVVKHTGVVDDRVRGLWLREYRLLAEFRHDHVVVPVDMLVDEAGVYLITPFLEGPTLSDWYADKPLEDRLRAFAGVAAGLEALHAEGIIHRDVKPDNVILEGGDSDRARLIDLQLAVRREERDNITGAGQTIVGTVPYFAPEVLTGLRAGPAQDVFAFGVSMYQCLVGRLPWPEGSLRHTLERVSRGPDEAALTALEGAVPPRLATLVERTLQPEPGDRPSMTDVRAELEALTGKRQRGPGDGAGPDIGHESTVQRPPELAAPGIDRRWWALLLVPALVVAVVVIGPSAAAVGWLVGIAAALGLLGAGLWAVRKTPAQLQMAAVRARIAAIERTVKDVSASVVAEIESKLTDERLRPLITETLVAVLADKGITVAGGGGGPAGTDYKKVLGYVGIGGGVLGVLTGGVGFLTSTRLWEPNQAPEVVSFVAQPERIVDHNPLRLAADARDEDGDLLVYRVVASAGEVATDGALARWTAPDDLDAVGVSFTLFVDDGHNPPATRQLAVVVNHAPEVRLDVPETAVPGDSVMLEANVSDADGDILGHRWQASCGALSAVDQNPALLMLSTTPCTVLYTVSDGFETATASATIGSR